MVPRGPEYPTPNTQYPTPDLLFRIFRRSVVRSAEDVRRIDLIPVLLQHQLAQSHVRRHGYRVLAVEAGSAELVLVQPDRPHGAFERQISERRRADILFDLIYGKP